MVFPATNLHWIRHIRYRREKLRAGRKIWFGCMDVRERTAHSAMLIRINKNTHSRCGFSQFYAVLSCFICVVYLFFIGRCAVTAKKQGLRIFFDDLEGRLNSDPFVASCHFKNRKSITVWWFGTWIFIFHILGRIIPSDFHIFSEGLKPPTRKWHVFEQKTNKINKRVKKWCNLAIVFDRKDEDIVVYCEKSYVV